MNSTIRNLDAITRAERAVKALSSRSDAKRELDDALEAIERLKEWLAEAETDRDLAVAEAVSLRRSLAAAHDAPAHKVLMQTTLRRTWRWHARKRCGIAFRRWCEWATARLETKPQLRDTTRSATAKADVKPGLEGD